MNATLQPGMPMPRDLRGIAGLGVAIPIPDVVAPPPLPGPATPAGHPSSISPRHARRFQVGGVITSATFAAAGLIAAQQGKGELASQLALFSILAGTVVSISQLFVEER